MSKINLLQSEVFNRIAAGEVVENPSSVIKELVENSIDAGADSITVEIRDGGISYMCVTDNGKGIDKEDIPLAFMPHATSKIRDMKDLEAIATLGFRGEALPSIASVADVELASRPADCVLGYKVVLRDGKIVDEGECGIPYGTKVTVKNIFANIPARAKFLRKPQAEEGAITELIAKTILANPYVKIKYIVDDNLQYQSSGNGVDSAVYEVYGGDFFQHMMPITHVAPGISITGLFCRPEYTKHNRTYQTLIVNGRYIVNSDISFCIQQCYQQYLMKHRFPAYVLYLELPPDMVDVNVHPNKLDVRFVGEKQLKGILYHAVKAKVDEAATVPTEAFSEVGATATSITQESTDSPLSKKENEQQLPKVNIFTSAPVDKPRISEDNIFRTKLNSFVRSVDFDVSQADKVDSLEKVSAQQAKTAQKLCLFGDERDIRYAGKLFNTYLFVESGNDFYIIDQHAAHEKLLYDKLVASVENGETAVQDMLVPYVFDVTPSEKAALCENLHQINACGFKIDLLSGCSFSLYALPVCCVNLDVGMFVSELLRDMESYKSKTAYIKESLMQAACKSAVKGEMDLSESEINSLISQMRESHAARFCPHGRPTVIKWSKGDLEKLFKRIV